MGRNIITVLVLTCGLTGCATHTPPPEADTASPPELTAERARAALIDLIRSPEPGELKDFPLARFEGEGVASNDGSPPSWGPFSLHLKEREYTYSRTFDPSLSTTMFHGFLGEIKRPDSGPADGLATIRYESREIPVQIIMEDQPFETTLSLAAEVVARLGELDKAAKRVIVADLRDAYNDGWNEYDEAQDDGSFKMVSNPKLSESEFEKKFSLRAVNVTGSVMVDFFYDDSRLFWGHSVVVTSMCGAAFSDARAEIFG